jgi:hypothetical protein
MRPLSFCPRCLVVAPILASDRFNGRTIRQRNLNLLISGRLLPAKSDKLAVLLQLTKPGRTSARGKANMAELKANGAQRSTASEHRAIRRKARTLHVHSKHTSAVQTVQNGAGIVRKAPRAAAEMTLKQQALAEIKAAC